MAASSLFRRAIALAAILFAFPASARTYPSPVLAGVTVRSLTGLIYANGTSAATAVLPGSGVNTALETNIGTAGSFVVNGGAGGEPSSINLTHGTLLPISGINGLGSGVGTALADGANASGGFVTSPVAAANLASGAAAANLGYTPLNPANNLSDVASATNSRTNLGLGGLATVTPGTNVATAVAANWAVQHSGIPDGRVGTNVAGAVETALNTASGLAAYVQGAGAPLNVVNCTIPNSAAVNSTWCPFEASNTGLLAAFFDTFSIQAYATCSTNQPSVQIFNVSNSGGAGTTTASNTPGTITNTSINAIIATSAATAQYAFKVTTAGVGCSSTLATEFISVGVTFRGG